MPNGFKIWTHNHSHHFDYLHFNILWILKLFCGNGFGISCPNWILITCELWELGSGGVEWGVGLVWMYSNLCDEEKRRWVRIRWSDGFSSIWCRLQTSRHVDHQCSLNQPFQAQLGSNKRNIFLRSLSWDPCTRRVCIAPTCTLFTNNLCDPLVSPYLHTRIPLYPLKRQYWVYTRSTES